ncbi:OTU domain-containing protein 6B [Tritrichomonas foetus]|uniref:OTU domain-containing protein 6B n=1 Tax=Tritrichomonas foetus TaxID=1144522 RepID=A0A1J4JQT9_9EUKA|nr:OTU domain-containing protein 6B [Tritrichomonas foetus]|eukprot:OHT01481.1 OTU domain-containing protein 6B [Tritrichomonas foetus]
MSQTEEIQERHQKEKDELEAKIQEMLKGAKSKNERKRLNKQAEDMRRELFEKQESETEDSFIKSLIDTANTEEPPKPANPPPAKPNEKPKKDLERNRQKRLKKAQQRYQLEAQLADVVNNTKTKGQIEIEHITDQLSKINMKMHSVLGDGHCLYRAVAYSLFQSGLKEYEDPNSFSDLRKRTAKELRENEEKYIGFSNCANHEEFEAHCQKVENSSDWGDELELMALSNALGYSFIVHRDGEEPITRGDFSSSLHLAFLLHYTTSGGHYNSVIPAGANE